MAKIKTKHQEAIEKEHNEKMAKVMNQVCNKLPEPPITILQEAHNIVHGDREQTYGDPGKNLRTIAAYWSTHLTASCGEKITLTEQDVCTMMILLKQARLASNPNHRDSMVDTAGYVAIADLLVVPPPEVVPCKS